MQLLPITYEDTRSEKQLFDLLPQSSSFSESSFSAEFDQAYHDQKYLDQKYDDKVRAEKERQEEEDRKAEERKRAMYASGAEVFSYFAPQPARFNKEELEKLAQAFRMDKVSIDAQNALKDIANKPEGPTLKELLAKLAQSTKGGNVQLDSNEISYLQNFAGRANPDMPTGLYNALRFGDSLTGLNALMASLKKNPTTMSQEELSAIAKALNLPEDMQKGMQKILAEFDKTQTLSKEQSEKLFGEAKAYLQAKADDFDKMQASLEKNIKSILSTAQKREEAERRALMREDREVLYSKALIQDTVITKAIGEELNRAEVNGKKLDEKEDQNKSATANVVKQEKENILTANKVKDERNEAKVAEKEFFAERDTAKANAKEVFENFEQDKQSFSEEKHGSDLKKHDTNTAEKAAEKVAASFSAPTQQTNQNINGLPLKFAEQAHNIRNQVQDSVLTMMKNGAKRLEVSLNPLELGELSVALTINKGEVNAVIQAEKPESAALINQQLDTIKAELENQGLKVQNLEVEVGLSKDNDTYAGQDWQGMQQHNNEQAFRETLNNLSYLRALTRRNSSADDTLAHNMQHIGSIVAGKENNSLQGLHIIA